MKVETAGGRIEFDRGVLERETQRAQFLQSNLGANAETLVDNEPHVMYRIFPEAGIAATVSFEGAKLREVAWQLQLQPEKEQDWSEENELARKRLHDDWLASTLGMPPYSYAWGLLESDYDSKGCASSIIVRYAD